MILVKIDVSKIDKTALFEGKTGKWLDLILTERKDAYGNDYMVAQGLSKERRQAGERGPILGNGKAFPSRGNQQPQQAQQPTNTDDVPF